MSEGCCSCFAGLIGKIIVGLITLAKVGCAIAIIIITALHLYNVTYDQGTAGQFTVNCQLGTSYENINLCDYAYAVCGLSLAISLAVCILLCCTCDLCGLGFLLETILAGVGTLWWLAASLVFTSHVQEANTQGGFASEVNNWRVAVVVLSWASMGLFALTFLIYLGRMLSKICSCCGCCEDDDDPKRT